MLVTFWGTRGSIAKAGPTTLRYGGNTSCMSVRSDAGTLTVIDCGTGAHGLGQALMTEAAGSPVDGHILISHTHWDHIQGLPFFAPLFEPGNHWHIYGPSGLGGSLGEILAGQMEYRYFPVHVDQLAADVEHHDLVEGTFDIAEVVVETRYLNHPALTLGYRLTVDGATVVYAADHEPHDHDLAAGGDVSRNRHDDAHARFIEGADLLVHDSQYRGSEYPDRIGWGHSTVEYVVELANRADVARVALFHHDPNRTDEQMDGIVELARSHAASIGYRGEVFAATEGMTVTLRGHGRDARGGTARDASTPVLRTGPAMARSLAVGSNAAVVAARTPEIVDVLASAARAEHLDVVVASDLEEAFDAIRATEPSVVLVEAIDDDGGFDLVAAIRGLGSAFGRDVPLIMVGPAAARWRPDAMETGISEWLVWPASPFFLRTKMRAWVLRRASRWQNAPRPRDEQQRVASLHRLGLLDTDPELRFDRFTEEISAVLDVPIALVTLVDSDRQWFKSRRGIAITETPRDVSLCAHAILGDDVLQIEDVLADPRFADNPMVAGDTRIRFYAGMPLSLGDGARVGTLCVADVRPRHLSAVELDELRRVARHVEVELERPTGPLAFTSPRTTG
jgi:phosphoribosyl 1,2-cyclic phosphodiesterase